MQLFKKILILLILIVSVADAQGSEVIYYKDTQTGYIDLSRLKGKWILLNYWAGWCGGCIEEIHELNKFYYHNKDKNVVIYGVNYDQLSKKDLIQVIKKLDIQFPVLVADPSVLWGLGMMEIIPVTFIINPAGKVVKKLLGPSTAQSLRASLNVLQKQP